MDQDTFEQKLKHLFIGHTIETIELYQINPDSVIIKESSQWIFDGGIQFNTKDGFFSIACNPDTVMFEYTFDHPVSDFLQTYDQLQAIPISVKEHIRSVCGKRITDIKCHWSYAQYYIGIDQLSEQKEYFPQEIQFTVDDGSLLQFADVCYEFDMKIKTPTDFKRGFSEDALILTLNDLILLD